VYGAALDAVYTISDLTMQALGYLTGRPVGEGKNADPRRVHCQLLDQIPDALDEAESFAGTRTRQHQQRVWRRLDGGTLGF
jgi:hypothetical protein